mgnify:CR=1 FL=1
MSGPLRPVRVPAWPAPRGYENGMLTHGPLLHIAGQIGWLPDGTFATDDLIEQFAQALDNVLAVVAAAGGRPEDVASMTVYVTDIDAYRTGVRALGPIWRARFGKHFPAMALIGVQALVEPRAKVEIVAVAALAPVAANPL